MTDDMSETFNDEDIVAAIESHDDPNRPSAATVEDVRDVLAAAQRGIKAYWDDYMDALEEGTLELVADDGGVLVLAYHDGHEWAEFFDGMDIDDKALRATVAEVHHIKARKHTDYSWETAEPLVVRKPKNFDAGQMLVEAVVNSLIQRGLSPGQAWAVYGVKYRGNSRNQWSHRCGYSSHSTVSEPLRKAEEVLNGGTATDD